jgi:hypothetical protein
MVVPYQEPQTEAQARPRRAVSEVKRLANFINAHKSSGARSERGRAAVAANGVVHGQTCNNTSIFLSDENPDEYANEVARWAITLKAETEPEVAQVGLAVYQLWKVRRTERGSAAAVDQKVEDIENNVDDQTSDLVRALIPQLPLDPARVVKELREYVCDCTYILGQLRLLRERLTTHPVFEVSQRRYVTQVLGHKPSDLFIDPFVYELDRLYLGSISGPGSFTPARAANAFLLDNPGDMSDREFEARLEPMVEKLPTIKEGHAGLAKLLEQAIEELTERVELLGLREERQRARAVVTAKDEVCRDGEKRKRNAAMAIRLHHASMRELRAMQESRRKYGAGDLDQLDDENHQEPAELGPENPAGSQEEAPAQGASAVAEMPAQGNPTVSQANDGHQRCDEAPAESELIREPSPESGLAQALAEAREFLRRTGFEPLIE